MFDRFLKTPHINVASVLEDNAKRTRKTSDKRYIVNG